MSAPGSDDEARAYVADLSARMAAQHARNQGAMEFLDWIQAMIWIGVLIVPTTFAFAVGAWLEVAKWGGVANLVAFLFVVVSPFAGIVATAGIIYVLGGPGSPNHLRPRR